MSLMIFIGAPSSGKTSYYNIYYKDFNKYVYICADDIRKELLGDANDQSKGNLIWSTLYTRVDLELSQNKNVIVDATFINRRARKDILKIAKKYNIFTIGLVFLVPFYKMVWRDFWRTKKVGYKVINKFLMKMEIPTVNEGFHVIDIIKN